MKLPCCRSNAASPTVHNTTRPAGENARHAMVIGAGGYAVGAAGLEGEIISRLD